MSDKFVRNVPSRVWWTALVVALAMAGFVTAVWVIPEEHVKPSATHPDGTEKTGGAVLLLVVSILAFALALASLHNWSQQRRWKDADRRKARIHKLTESLEEALRDIEAIHKEVTRGAELLARLEADAATKAQLAALTDSESAAVRDLVEGAVRRETNRGTLWNVVVGALFFAAGLVAARLIGG